MLTALYSGIIVRLYTIQIRDASFFQSLGNQQYNMTIMKTPDRAAIYDRHGTPLAFNKPFLSAFLTPLHLNEREKTITFLTEHFPETAQRLKEHPRTPFLYIRRRVSPAEEHLMRSAQLADISFLEEPGRWYPVESAAPLIGLTTIDNEGAAGIELSHNEQLRGKASLTTLKRDARRERHFYFAQHLTEAGHEGAPVTLTIDSMLQFLTYEAVKSSVEEWKAVEGMAVTIDPATGDILAMVSYPCCNPHELRNLVLDHLKNRVVTETYEFGSVMKVFLALAALAEGVVTLDTPFNCYNTKNITLDGMKLSTWHEHGTLSFREVIAKSNNIGTAQVARLLQEKLYHHYRRCGFGTKVGHFIGEQAGYITPPHTWSQQSLASLSYGYEIRATLLQLACAFCMIARNGVPVIPRLIITDNPLPPHDRVYEPEVITQLEAILEHTVQHGTAIRTRIPGCHVMGKTGSANLLVDGVYDPHKSIFTFAGIVTQKSYQRVIVVCIKEPQQYGVFASQVAAPLFKKIAEATLIHEGIIPSSERTL
jgi:cell division protein FtsI (penicillin-binding protein 3)